MKFLASRLTQAQGADLQEYVRLSKIGNTEIGQAWKPRRARPNRSFTVLHFLIRTKAINCEVRLVTKRFRLAHDYKEVGGRATQVAKAEKIMDLIGGSLC